MHRRRSQWRRRRRRASAMSVAAGRRLTTSWWTVAAVFVLCGIASIVGLTILVDNVQRRADQTAIETAQVIASLTVHRNISEADFGPQARLSPVEVVDLDGDFAALASAHHLIGLAIWTSDGRLLYANSSRQASADPLSADEVARIRDGIGWVTMPAGNGPSVRDVYVPYDAGTDGIHDGLLELVIPGAPIEDTITRATHELYALAAMLLVVSGFTLWALRRRLVRRDHDATHDRLTDLLNWGAFRDVLRSTTSSTRSNKHRSAVLLLIGLDRFKSVNEALGHPAGDELLVLVARNISSTAGHDATVARIGGDEFAVLLLDVTDDGAALASAADLLRCLHSARFEISGVAVAVEASIGIATPPSAPTDADELLRQADVAMHNAKRAGIGAAIYTAADDHRNVAELTLLGELRTAIDNHELVLHYQPKAHLASRDVHAVEALVRWNHPTRGLLAPDAFIPLAERSGVLWPLTNWVLTQSIGDAANWHRRGMSLAVAVNVSPRGLFENRLPDVIAELLERNALPAALLEIEILETAIMTDPQRSLEVLGELRTLGVRIALDDFGTGYTSLSYLKSLPVDTLKIDKSFMTELLDDDRGHAVVQSMIELAHRLGLEVIAEGIETEAIWNELERLSCDLGQGYLLARPMPSEQMEGWITAHRRGRAGTSAGGPIDGAGRPPDPPPVAVAQRRTASTRGW